MVILKAKFSSRQIMSGIMDCHPDDSRPSSLIRFPDVHGAMGAETEKNFAIVAVLQVPVRVLGQLAPSLSCGKR